MGTLVRQTQARPDLSPEDFDRIATVIESDAGIELPRHKRSLVQSRVARRLKELGLASFHAYCDLIETVDGAAERLEMTAVLTTNVTGFYREGHHFDYLREIEIPKIVQRLKAGKRVRVWSAGCSSGEEPYSLALTFLEVFPEVARYDFKILATDIDQVVLRTAIKGVYAKSDLTPVPEHLRQEFFEPAPQNENSLSVSPKVREIIVFRRLNLVDAWPFTRPFDLIMCRNVVIYFGDTTKSKIWTGMAQQLKQDGLLLTGHSERLSGPAASKLELIATTTYRPMPPPRTTKRDI